MKLSLKIKFLVPALLLTILGVTIQGSVTYINSKSAIRELIERQLVQHSLSETERIDSWIDRNQLDIKTWSGHSIYKTAAKETFVGKAARRSAIEQLTRLKDDYKFYEAIFLSNLDGNILAASYSEQNDENIDLSFYDDSSSGDLVVSKIMKSKSTGEPVFMIASPVKDMGTTVAVLVGVIRLNVFTKNTIDTLRIGENGYAYIYDQNGLVIAHPDKSNILKLNMAEFDFGRDMMSKHEGLYVYEYQGVEKTVAFNRSGKTGWTICVGAVNDEIFAPVSRIGGLSVAIILIIALFLSVFMWMSSNQFVLKPISNAVAGLRDIAEGEGDLSNRLAVSSEDEVGELSKWFNTFIEKLQIIITDIKGNANTLNEASNDLFGLSGSMSSSAREMATKSSDTTVSAEEMSRYMNTVATTMDEASSNISMIATSADEMTATINEIAKNSGNARVIAQGAVSEVESATDMVSMLGEAANDIGKVTETITDISDQTNLLALNATIEAARAGDAGKGFAVVANEIKELARQTVTATREITDRILSIQASSSGTIDSIKKISKVINQVEEIVGTIAASVEEQSVTTQEIAKNVGLASSGFQEVNNNVSHSTTVTAGIAKSISDVNQISKDMSQNSARVNNSAEALSNLAGQLKNLVERFKV